MSDKQPGWLKRQLEIASDDVAAASVAAKALEALRLWEQADEHRRGCHDCGGNLSGEVWTCAGYDRLFYAAEKLRDEVLAAVAGG